MSNLVGQVIGHYRLDDLIGDGGMGTVYRAYDLNLERTVALKVMHAHIARNAEFRARLTQEAKTAAQLDHPSIVRIFDFGQYDGGQYIAMEYVGGGSLRAHLQRLQERQRYLPLEQSLQIAAQIADALDYAHRRGAIHRDVKPSNIILKPLSRPDQVGEQPFRAVLTDFGLVKLLDGSSMTEVGTTLGTPAYMSPEQCEGLSLDGRSDLYSLGVVLYELATNRLPFQFRTLSEAMATHMRGVMPPPPRQFRPDLPPFVDALLSRSLAKDRSDRFASGAEMVSALRSAMYSLEGMPTQVVGRESQPRHSLESDDEPGEGLRLKIETPGHPASFANLSRSTITIGRSADNDIVLPAEGVSRHHARLQLSEGSWTIVDLGGINGTWLDEVRLRADEARPLVPGSVVEIGPYRLSLTGAAAKGDAAAAATIAAFEAARQTEVPIWDQPTDHGMAVQPNRPAGVEGGVGALDIYLAREQLTVEPGRRADLKVEIVNRGTRDDRVSLRIYGLPGSWISLPDDFFRVPAGESVTVPVSLHPPQTPETTAGRHRFRVELVSQQYPDLKAAASATLIIGPFAAFQMRLEPRELALPGIVQVHLQNAGNSPGEFSLLGRDPQGVIQFQGEQGRIQLQPGQAATVDMELEPKQRRWLGGFETYDFEIEAVSRNGSRQSVSGRATISARLPVWLAYGALFLFIFVCVLSALVLVFQRDRFGAGPGPTPPLVEGNAATATSISATNEAILATATYAAATEAAATAGALGDRDQDGLSDAQEAVVGTDPDNPDTDGDGLLDGEEVLTWGSNPRNRDTDADILLDGDEVHVYGTSPTNPDTDGDSFPDGVEIAMGTNPLDPNDPPPTVTATSTAPTATSPPTTATATPTLASTPTATSTSLPTNTPTVTNTPEPSSTPTSTATATETPTATPTPTPTVTLAPAPRPALACVSTPPTIDGVVTVTEWEDGPLFTFVPDGDAARRVQGFLTRDGDHLYVAFVIGDPTSDLTTDSLRFYIDANDNAGDPDFPDRFFQITRDGTQTVRAGLGTNSDGNDWDASYESQNWEAAVGEPGANRWVVEMQIDAASELPDVQAGNPFSSMVLVLYTGSQAIWPEGGETNDAGTWQPFANALCQP